MPTADSPTSFARLRRLARPRAVEERCELCAAIIPPAHQHLLELDSRKLTCACDACAILFSSDATRRYRRVSRRVKILSDLPISDAMWESLAIPINLAFFYRDSTKNRMIAMYPSPAGATESLLSIDAGNELGVALAKLEDDIEALLVNRVGKQHQIMLVPIDACYELVGVLRSHWRGLSGGSEVWSHVENFFQSLRKRADREVPRVIPDLNFQVESVHAEPLCAMPTLLFKLRIDQPADAAPIHAIALRCQIRLEPARRHYTDEQKDSLLELFGLPVQWGQTLRPMLWTHASAIVPAFTGSTIADLPVTCTFDFNIAATKYFDALQDDGEIPLCLLFSGTVFYEGEDQRLQAAPISWEKEADFRLPARTWREMMQQYYPNTGWLGIDKDVFDRLRRFKAITGAPTWERAFETLLDGAQQKVES